MNNSQASKGDNSKIRRGLVLEGGGAKGAWQFGALEALDEAGIKFDYVGGTSVGALNGALWAAGRLDLGEKLWTSLSLSKVYKLRLHHSPMFVIGLFARIFYAYVKGFFSPTGAPAPMRDEAPLSLRVILYSLMNVPMIVVTIYLLSNLISLFSTEAPKTPWVTTIVGGVGLIALIGGLLWGIIRNTKIRRGYFYFTSLVSWIVLLSRLFFGFDPSIGLKIPTFLWILVAIPFVIFCIATFLRRLNTSIFSVAPLEAIIEQLPPSEFKIPLFATVGREIHKYYDPDNPQYSDLLFSGSAKATPRSTIMPGYLKVNSLSKEDALTTLLATSALPLGITPRRQGRHAVSPKELSAVLEVEAEEFSKLTISRMYRKSSHKLKVFLFDGGVVDNLPWYPFIEDEPCDQIVIVRCNKPEEDLNEFKMKEEWRDRSRLERVVKLSLQYDVRKEHGGLDEERRTFIVGKDGTVRYNEQGRSAFDRNKHNDSKAIKKDPPIVVPFREPKHWPKSVVIIEPDAALGNFLTGTLNFSPDVARKRRDEGRKKASCIIKKFNLLPNT